MPWRVRCNVYAPTASYVVSNDEMQESLDEKWAVVKEAAESIEPDESTPDLGQIHDYFQVVNLLKEEVEMLKKQL